MKAPDTQSRPTPETIMKIGMGFMASKTVISAAELKLFTVLGEGSATADELGERLQLHPRARADFLDALVALGLLDRDGDGPGAHYRNTREGLTFLVEGRPTYIGGILQLASTRMYHNWGRLTTALRTGEPQNDAGEGGDLFFDSLYTDPERLTAFLSAMQSIQMGNFTALLQKVDLSGRARLCDAGGANGTLAALVARRYPDIRCVNFDLPAVSEIARAHVERMGVADRVDVVAGDFFKDPMPEADVITMGNVLHVFDEEGKRALIARAHAALPEGGMLIAIENVIDDARRVNAFGLLMSLTMLIEARGGFDYTGAQFDVWCRDAGFSRTEVIPLAGPGSAAIAHK